jgi:hypothetical protein
MHAKDRNLYSEAFFQLITIPANSPHSYGLRHIVDISTAGNFCFVV